jgi:hypothetical protein
MRGRQAARKQLELAETSVPLEGERAGLKGCWRLRMCQQAIRILRATADLAGFLPARFAMFERYCDDVIVHARSEQHARELRAAIASRLAECGLELNEQKTRITYCKDSMRRGSYEHERFDFLGYTFRPRLSRSKSGGQFVNFLPAVSDDARKRIGREIRRWRLHRWSGKTLTALARSINLIVQGWINYYGRFYRSELVRLLNRSSTVAGHAEARLGRNVAGFRGRRSLRARSA